MARGISRAALGFALGFLGFGAAVGSPAPPQEDLVDFARDVRPILSDRCFVCHGPDAEAREANLRLDTSEGALADLGGYAAIVPGDTDASELVHRIREEHASERMPPAKSKLTLSAEEIDLLVRWVEQGAEYQQHWAFVPPEPAPVPMPVDASWALNEVDRFVLIELERNGLQPAPLASRATWVRRASLDLTGLPPTLEELDAFLAQPATEESWETELDRLFASPRYGERMAADWLDAARYADTYGYQSDVERRVWPWRDWVIAAFNANQPWDEFVTDQLAGDLLESPTREQRLATAFNRLHRQTNEGGSVEQEYRLEYVSDRVHTFGTAFLGLTFECARCHDHKYDPITQKEYYQLSAFFDDIDESGLYSHFTNAVPTPALDLPTPEQEKRLAELNEEKTELYNDLIDTMFQGTARQSGVDPVAHYSLDDHALPNGVVGGVSGAVADAPLIVEGYIGQALEFSGENSAYFEGVGQFKRSDPFSISLWLWVPESYERAVVLHRSRAWTDAGSRGYQLLIENGRLSASLIHFWPGNAIRVRSKEPLPTKEWVHVCMTYDGSSFAGGLELSVNGRSDVEVVRNSLTRTIQGGGEGPLTLAQRFRDRGLQGGRIDELRVYARRLHPTEVQHLAGLGGPNRDITTDAIDAIQGKLRANDAERDSIRDAIPAIMTMEALPVPRVAHVLKRGSYLTPGEEVRPGTPAGVLSFAVDLPPDRAGLARWLTAPENPLFARVSVNRFWQLAFGRGLVKTSENFGSQGSPPSHPELLDWLAVELRENGWDVQELLRTIMLSRTYRLSSRVTPEQLALDPENTWLARAPRVRLTAEMVRDSALHISGLLAEKQGGPSVKPYQPAGLWQDKSGQVYNRDQGEGLYRRSLYTFWKRTSPPPSMTVFDASKRDVCVARRQSTSTPLQALALWNDPQRVEAARKFAEKVTALPVTGSERLAIAFRMATGRPPLPDEQKVLESLLADMLLEYVNRPGDAAALLATGDAPVESELAPTRLAAWTMVATTLLGHDAALTRY